MEDACIDDENLFADENLFTINFVGLDSINHKHITTKFPHDMKDVQQFLTKGAHSIMKNFPFPKAFNLYNHACVGLEETIRIMAGHHRLFGFAWDGRTQKPNRDGLNVTKLVADLVNYIFDAMKSGRLSDESICETHIGWVYVWSDSFLCGFVKQKDNSVWILTVTICPPLNKINSGRCTHVLAMGKSSKDHTSVIEYYYREVKKLMKGFQTYFGATNKIWVVFSILLTDQKNSLLPTPERRDILESAPIIPTVSTLTNYQHASNAIKNHFQSYFQSSWF
jgi:hypothetical protein